ncbi:MAG: pseudaminic acid biosynthesis-associated methylase [Candidatus Acidiferrales bacterium]
MNARAPALNSQLETWSGEFGRAYTNRNALDWQSRLPAFRSMIEGLKIHRVLEIGCNRGHNLIALSEILGAEAEIAGIEPNRYALECARSLAKQAGILPGNIFDLPFKTGYFDLAFTAGVLIHIALESLPAAIQELARVSRRYLLAIEYFAEEETAISYRGHDNLLWKRDFLRHFKECLPNFSLMRSGHWDLKDGFDRSHWWLFEKPSAESEETAGARRS